MYKLDQTFAVLKPDLAIDAVPVSPTLYRELDANYNQFAGHVLISEHEFSAAWTVWERHPAGDEMVVLLSGSATIEIETTDGNRIVTLSEPGAYAIIPRGCWHTAIAAEPTRMLFVTPGEGTENRSIA